MSAWWSASQFCTWGRRTLRELTFQVAIFMMFPCVLLGGKAADCACGNGRYCIADWFIFRYGLKVTGRLKADVSDGLDVAMWNNLFMLLGL